MKKFLLILAVTLVTAITSGCANGVRITNLPDKYVEVRTNEGKKVHTVVKKGRNGKVVGEIITTDRWEKKKTKSRPYRWRDYHWHHPYWGGRYYR